MFNSDELTPPEFLDDDLFQNVLRQHFRSPTTFKRATFSPASKAGDHFASTMFKVNIEFLDEIGDSQNLFVVLKTSPVNEGFKKRMLNHRRAFESEFKLYSRVLPEIERLLETTIAPKFIFYQAEPHLILVLEDLTVRGFSVPDELFTLERTKAAVEILAKFHAGCTFLGSKNEDVRKMQNSYFHIHKEDFQIATQSILPNISLFRESVRNVEGFEVISERLKRFEDSFLERLHEVYKGTNKRLLTLCHTDFHIKNLMVVEETQEMLLLDFQFCSWGTAVIDLYYVFYQVGDLETRTRHRREVLEHYHGVLRASLERLGYSRPVLSLDELEQEVTDNAAAEVMQIICFYKYRFMRWDSADIETKLAQDPFYQTRTAYRDPDFLAAARVELQRLVDLGVL